MHCIRLSPRVDVLLWLGEERIPGGGGCRVASCFRKCDLGLQLRGLLRGCHGRRLATAYLRVVDIGFHELGLLHRDPFMGLAQDVLFVDHVDQPAEALRHGALCPLVLVHFLLFQPGVLSLLSLLLGKFALLDLLFLLFRFDPVFQLGVLLSELRHQAFIEDNDILRFDEVFLQLFILPLPFENMLAALLVLSLRGRDVQLQLCIEIPLPFDVVLELHDVLAELEVCLCAVRLALAPLVDEVELQLLDLLLQLVVVCLQGVLFLDHVMQLVHVVLHVLVILRYHLLVVVVLVELLLHGS